MKTIKKLLALVLAIAVCASLALPAFATNHSITAPTGTTHTYEIYQIFTGTVSGDDLTNLKYGQNTSTGRTATNDVTDADLSTLAGITDAGNSQAQDQADIASILPFVNLSSTPIATIGADHDASASLVEGYYLIKDVGPVTGDDQYSLHLVKLLKDDLTITPKVGGPTSEKKLDDVNDSTGAAENLQDSADYDIGDNVPFHLKATTGSNVNAYKKYHLTFEDTLESGKFEAISDLTFTIAGVAVSEFPYIDDTNGFKVTKTVDTAPSTDGFKVTLTFEPTDATAGALLPAYLNSKEVKIDFTAQLGQNATLGQEGNVNSFVLKYSNNPNSTDDSEEGTAPEDTVIVFTYKLTVNKTNAAGEELTGATFSLYKKYATAPTGGTAYTGDGYTGYYLVETIAGTDKSTFEFKGIDDGDYLLVEDVAPTNYNAIAPQAFTVTASHVTSADINKTSHKDSNGDYLLTSISGTAASGAVITLASETDNSGVNTTVVNQSGATLPETGGIGTTIFYVTGAVLALGAGILLVTKKRMSR